MKSVGLIRFAQTVQNLKLMQIIVREVTILEQKVFLLITNLRVCSKAIAVQWQRKVLFDIKLRAFERYQQALKVENDVLGSL